jgi:outer membrane receptor for ferrienterochelin and colicin
MKISYQALPTFALALSCCTFTAHGSEALAEDIFKLDIEELLNIQVYTASRDLSPIEQASSVITVISAEEIRQRGYKSIKEVLDRVPGFFNSPDISLALIGNRGYSQNPNNNYLLLLDGHALNSVADEGIGNSHMLPFIYQIKRIEIVRGPGSTLWGSDAANGIINLITFDGKDLATESSSSIRVSFDYEASRPRHIANLLLGGRLGEEGDFMLSLTQSESRAGFLDVTLPGADGLINIPNVENADFEYKHESWRPSYEIHSKLSWQDFSIVARSYRYKGFYRETTAEPNQDIRDFDFDYLALAYSPKITSNIDLEIGLYHNWIDNPWRKFNPDGSLDTGWDSSYKEAGLDAILSFRGIRDHRLKTGLQWKRRDFAGQYFLRPGRERFETVVGIENAKGIFIEDEYFGFTDWRLTLGLRYQENDLRQAGSEFLYRAAAVYQIDPQLTVKYLYNTGFVPAALTRSRGSAENPLIVGNFAEVGPAKQQLAFSHDLQLLYSSVGHHFSITLFKQDIEQFIARINPFLTGEILADGTPVRIRETNVGDLSAHGVELDSTLTLNRHTSVYGNFAWALNKIKETRGSVPGLPGATFDLVKGSTYFKEDGQMTGMPEFLWNMGLDWRLETGLSINLHYRGWSGNWGKTSTQTDFESYGTQHYFDLNLRCISCTSANGELQLYAKNLFNNKAVLPQSAHGGHIEGLGREVGIAYSYKF